MYQKSNERMSAQKQPAVNIIIYFICTSYCQLDKCWIHEKLADWSESMHSQLRVLSQFSAGCQFSKNFLWVFPGGGYPYNGPYEEAPTERGTFFRLQAYESVVEAYESVGKSVMVFERT